MIDFNDYKTILSRHPYLKPRDFSGNIIEDADFTVLDYDIPKGWKLLCYMMFEEIREHLLETNELEQFQVLQLKEKYGTIRCYTNGNDRVISNIIYKYEAISENVCQHCGKPHTPVSGSHYIWTCCEDCYKGTYMAKYRPYLDEFPCLADERDETKYLMFNNGEQETVVIDLKETRNRYEEMWKCQKRNTM